MTDAYLKVLYQYKGHAFTYSGAYRPEHFKWSLDNLTV